MDANDAGRVIKVIDNRIDKKVGSLGRTDTTWAEVCEVTADGKNCSAYLYGDTDNPSQGFRVPGTLAVSVGDKVKVAWNDRGERWVEDVALPSAYKKVAINPNTGEILTGDGTVAPTPFAPAGVPTAAVIPYAGASAPDGWLLCDGTAVSRDTYADLFAIVGTTYGAGDGSTTFNLPDLRQRFPLGKAASGTGSTLGGTGGSIDHTHTSAAHSHSHSHSTPAHSHSHSHSMQGHTHASTNHLHTLSAAGYALLDISAGASTINLRMRRVGSLSYTPTVNITGVTYTGSASAGATTGLELDGATDETTPAATGGPSTASTGTDTANGGSSTSGTDATSTTPGATGSNNPPFLTLNYLIKA